MYKCLCLRMCIYFHLHMCIHHEFRSSALSANSAAQHSNNQTVDRAQLTQPSCIGVGVGGSHFSATNANECAIYSRHFPNASAAHKCMCWQLCKFVMKEVTKMCRSKKKSRYTFYDFTQLTCEWHTKVTTRMYNYKKCLHNALERQPTSQGGSAAVQ